MTEFEAEIIYNRLREAFPLSKYPQECPEPWKKELVKHDYVEVEEKLDLFISKAKRAPGSIAELIEGLGLKGKSETRGPCKNRCMEGWIIWWCYESIYDPPLSQKAVRCEHDGQVLHPVDGIGRADEMEYTEALAKALEMHAER